MLIGLGVGFTGAWRVCVAWCRAMGVVDWSAWGSRVYGVVKFCYSFGMVWSVTCVILGKCLC